MYKHCCGRPWDRPLIWTVLCCWISLQYCEASKSTPDLRTTQAAAGNWCRISHFQTTPLTGFNNSWNHMAICIGKLRGSPRPSPPQLRKCPIRCVLGAWKYLSSAIFGNQVWACLLWCSRKTRGAANIDQLVSCLPNRGFLANGWWSSLCLNHNTVFSWAVCGATPPCSESSKCSMKQSAFFQPRLRVLFLAFWMPGQNSQV